MSAPPPGLPRYPQIPHLFGSQWDPGDVVLGLSETRQVLAGDCRVYEKLDGHNLALGFAGPYAVWLQFRGQAPRWCWELPSPLRALSLWAAQNRGALYRVLGEEVVVYGEWMATPRRVPYPRLPDAFCAFDFFHRGQQRWLEDEPAARLWREEGLWSAPLLHRGSVSSLEGEAWREQSKFGGELFEGLVVRSGSGIYKWVRESYAGLPPCSAAPVLDSDTRLMPRG